MANIKLYPNSTVSNNWTKSQPMSTVHGLMANDHTGNITTDSFHLRDTATGEIFELDFDNFTEDFSSIDSVQAVVKAGNNNRGQSFAIEMTINDALAGAFWSAESSGTQLASAGYRTITFTSRTTSDGSSAWTNTNINSLRMKVELTTISGGTTYATYCYFIVTYTPPSDNAIFFGTNF
tara:strand:- start:2510 stop:3046 length:537 start_codon:yes stop_codon:yes gene_type:complete